MPLAPRPRLRPSTTATAAIAITTTTTIRRLWGPLAPAPAPAPLLSTAAAQCRPRPAPYASLSVLTRKYTATATTTTTTTGASAGPPPPPSSSSSSPSLPPPLPPPPQPRALTAEDREFLDRALRVNQAGELGANLIYSGQHFVFRHDARLGPLVAHMWEQEKTHLRAFDGLLRTHRVRPTALRPLWNIAGSALGLATAALGEKAAMACTEAVETEIGAHYNDQVRALLRIIETYPELSTAAAASGGQGAEGNGNGNGLGGEKEEGKEEEEEGEGELHRLVRLIRRFRDEELEHLDTAVEHDSKGAEGYEVLTAVIRSGCKAAIWLSSRI